MSFDFFRVLHACFLVILTLPGIKAVQATDISDSNSNLWLNYVGDHRFSEDSKWGLHLESQFRRADFGENWQQILLRPGVNYTISPMLTLSSGYAWVKTYPYGDIPIAADFPEHRLWQQAIINHEWLGLQWTHRFRLEQRQIGEVSPDSGDVTNWRYENRIRYMVRTTLPIDDEKQWYLALWDEVFFNFGPNVLGNHFDQNRAFVGIGHQLNPSTRLELGYMEQTIQRRGGNVWENNHTIVLWVMAKLPFSR